MYYQIVSGSAGHAFAINHKILWTTSANRLNYLKLYTEGRTFEVIPKEEVKSIRQLNQATDHNIGSKAAIAGAGALLFGPLGLLAGAGVSSTNDQHWMIELKGREPFIIKVDDVSNDKSWTVFRRYCERERKMAF